MRKKILCTLLLGTTFAHAMAVTPLWMRDVRIHGGYSAMDA